MTADNVTAATLKKWIVKRALEIGDEFAEKSRECAGYDIKMADYYYGHANGVWSVVKAIQLGSYRPAKARKRKARTT